MDAEFGFLPCEAGEGDRVAVEGAGVARSPPPPRLRRYSPDNGGRAFLRELRASAWGLPRP